MNRRYGIPPLKRKQGRAFVLVESPWMAGSGFVINMSGRCQGLIQNIIDMGR